jgi:cobalt-zinc-cadmium efflux system protein
MTHAPHQPKGSLEQRFIWSLILNGGLAITEAVGGIITGSSALLADGLMNSDDTVALVLSIYSERKSKLKPDARRTFGYGRMDDFAGFVKGVLLLLTAFITVLQAVRLLVVPEAIPTTFVIVMGFISLAVNFFSAYILKADACCSTNANTTYSCMKYDAYGSIALIASGVLARFYPTAYFDIAAAFLIAFFMVWTGWDVFKEGARLFLQSAPKNFNMELFEQKVRSIKGVVSVGDIHVWSYTPIKHHLTCKVTVQDGDVCVCHRVIEEVETVARNMGIQHVTVQPVYTEESLERFCAVA